MIHKLPFRYVVTIESSKCTTRWLTATSPHLKRRTTVPLPRLSCASQVLCIISLLLFIAGTIRAQEAPPFANPSSITSAGGVLNATLTVQPATVSVAGVSFNTNVYNGLYAPPVLRVRPGDVMHLKLVNKISTKSDHQSSLSWFRSITASAFR
jgi:hypothetical protein